MVDVANLADVYEAVFGEPPSAMTRGSLLAMAHAFRITDNDPLGPVIVMSMRSADQVDAALRQRSADEKTHRERLREVTGELHGLLELLAVARSSRWSWRRSVSDDSQTYAAPSIVIGRRSSPLFSYLGHAFLARNGVIDRDDRIVAARLDLLFLAAIALACAVVGAALGDLWPCRVTPGTAPIRSSPAGLHIVGSAPLIR